MTTTAHEDQFTDAPESVRQPYDTGSILRRNVADLELALKQQTERAESAEAELAKAREHEREWCAQLCEWLPVGTGYEGKTFAESIRGNGIGGKLADGFIPSFRIAEPVPAVAAPAAPEDWRNIVTEMLGWWDDPAMTMSQGKVIAEKARALLQSAPTGEPK